MDLSLRAMDLRFRQYAEVLGIPPKPVLQAIRARRLVGHWGDWRKRRARAEDIRRTSPHGNLIDRDKGYYKFEPDFLPGVGGAIAEALNLIEKKQASVAGSKKPFFANVMTAADVQSCPEIMALAQHPMMFEAAAGYLGTYPKLRSVGIYVSEANSTQVSSQMFHFDMNDLTQIKCFININDVGPDNGPFTFLPADRTKASGLPWVGSRFEDKNVFEKVRQDELVSLIGPPGTGAFVDTSRCLHFGSRCRADRRIVIMTQYTPQPDLSLKLEKYSQKGTAVLIGED